jgi:2-oxoglutarate dehydrogenase E1 component
MFHDLLKAREEREAPVAIVRIEQLYPFPTVAVRRVLNAYAGAGQPVWVQEEPANMGAWRFLQATFKDRLGVDLASVTREESASPSTGSLKVHNREQAALVDSALETGEVRQDA